MPTKKILFQTIVGKGESYVMLYVLILFYTIFRHYYLFIQFFITICLFHYLSSFIFIYHFVANYLYRSRSSPLDNMEDGSRMSVRRRSSNRDEMYYRHTEDPPQSHEEAAFDGSQAEEKISKNPNLIKALDILDRLRSISVPQSDQTMSSVQHTSSSSSVPKNKKSADKIPYKSVL